jgi:hypothetical protein
VANILIRIKRPHKIFFGGIIEVKKNNNNNKINNK